MYIYKDYFGEDFALAEAAKPLQDKIYKHIFGNYLNRIIRFSKDKDDRHILDIEYHIDTQLEFINGISILGQEKALRQREVGWNTYTIEFYQNRHTKEKGEFFNLGAQFYLHGYLNGNKPEEVTRFIKCYFIKIFDFLEWLKIKPIKELELKTKPTQHSKASFYWINYNEIPKEFIYYYFNNGIDLIKKPFFDFLPKKENQLNLFNK